LTICIGAITPSIVEDHFVNIDRAVRRDIGDHRCLYPTCPGGERIKSGGEFDVWVFD
jgi:hypothetical protein